jgi:general secretion pathway protein J
MRRQRGFTLVEILVASAIAAILAAMAFVAVNDALRNREQLREAQARLVALQYTVRTMVQDFSQLAPRPVRASVGEGYEPALAAIGGLATEVHLTRYGWNNPAGIQRSSLQRVRYRLRDGVLYREYWLALDAQLQPEPVERAVLDRVRSFTLRFMNESRQWQDNWPPPQPGGEADLRFRRWRPIAVEVTLDLEDMGVIRRLIEVPG